MAMFGNHIRVDLIDHMGSDLTVVDAARVSTNRDFNDFEYEYEEYVDTQSRSITEVRKRRLRDRDKNLIEYLAKHNHWTPFAHCMVTLSEEVPIFVARQRFKHTVGFVYNEVSRRYVYGDPEFYDPDAFRKRSDSIKQGSLNETVDLGADLEHHFYGFHRDALELYLSLLEKGVCPEQARMVLPQSMMTRYYVTGSLAAFARAYKLRSDKHAQKEIQYLAEEWDRILKELFPCSWKALKEN